MSLNIQLLDRLCAVPGEYVPLEELGPDLEQVRGDLTSLVSFGFVIEQHPYRVRLMLGQPSGSVPTRSSTSSPPAGWGGGSWSGTA